MAKGKMGYKVRTIVCVACGKSVTDHMRAGQKYCSLDCYRAHPRPQRMTGAERPCEVCGILTYIDASRLKRTKTFFCSPEHANQWQGRNRDSYICKTCGTPFTWSASRKAQTNPTYCSPSCRDADPERRESLIQMNAAQATVKPNKLEIAGYAILDDIGIPYKRQELMFGKFCVDAVYPDIRLVVQFDGDYWHGNPVRFPNPDSRQSRRMWMDKAQDAYMAKAGYAVIRLWERDVKSAQSAVTGRVLDAIHAAASRVSD